MIQVKTVDLRNNLAKLLNQVTERNTKFLITRPKTQKNVVLISEEELEELLKIKRNQEYLNKIEKSLSELENGKYKEMKMVEI